MQVARRHLEADAGNCAGDAMITRRHMLAATAGFAGLAATGAAAAQAPTVPTRQRNGTMEIKRNGAQPSRKAPAEYFTGAVRVDPLFQAPDPARVSGSSVTFEPGARTAWHTHPLGQTLIIASGLGWVRREGGPIEEVRPGDVVWFPPGLKHWHGATPTTAMTHIAIQEAAERQECRLDGKGQRRAIRPVMREDGEVS
ncbi:MAG: cupin domain-containing protein [Xanthobacteraceae bacterium]